jgi:Mg/Co/Ni transporter MgtE
MKLLIKILVIYGINDKTISEFVDTNQDSTMQWLLDYIRNKFSINLLETTAYIALLDGKSVNLKDIDLNIAKSSELLVIPMISGG